MNAGSVTNTATVTATNPRGASVADPSTATVRATQSPALTLDKTASPATYNSVGTLPEFVATNVYVIINYTVTVDNTGNVGLDNVQVDDPMLAGALTCTPAIGSRLEAGARMTCTGAHRVTQGDVDAVSLVNTVSVTGTPPAGAAPTASTDLTIPSSHQPGLTLEKRSGAHTYSRVGETIAFEFVATNTGNVTLIGLALTDALAGVSAPSCPETTLAPGASVTCTASYVVTQADLDAGVLDNAATATATDPDGRAASADGTTSLTALTNPSLSLDKTALTPTVSRAGELTRYQFVVTNDGNVSVSNVQLADSLEGISAFDCAPALGGTLAPGATMTCTAERAARQYGIDNGHIDNTATVTGTDPAGNAVAPASDSARITVEQNPAITLTKTPSVSTFDAVGDQITYTIVATNTGNVTLGNVFASDPLPGMTNWTCDRSGPISLAPGEAKTCTGTKTATQADLDAGSIMNTARVTSQRPDGSAMPVVTAPAVVLAEVTTGLTLSKTADRTRVAAAGDTITYTFDAHNTGTVTINDVRITDPLAGLSELTCSPQLGGSVAPGAAMHCTATKTVTPAEMDAPTIDNHATVTATGANGAALSAEASATVIPVHQPKLTVTKTASAASVSAVGDPLTYTIVVANTGNALVNDVSVADSLPGLSALSCDRQAPVTLDVGQSMTCTATYSTTQADLDAGSVVNTATPAGTDPNGDPVTLEPGSATVPAEASPQLTLNKTSPTALVAAVGEQVRFDFAVRNTGNVTVGNIAVDDPVAGLGAITCDAASPISLAPGAAVHCWADYTVSQDDMNAHRVVNTATVGGTQPNGTALTPAQQGRDELTIPTDSRAELTLTKTGDKTQVSNIGEVIGYTLVVRNSGNETVTQVSPTDAKPGVTISSCDRTLPAALQPGDVLTCQASYTATTADFDAGAITNTASVDGATALGQRVPASASFTVTTDQSPQVSLVKQADRTTVSRVGDTITYTVVATNTGNVSVTDFNILDTLPGLTQLGCTRPMPATLAVGETVTCTGSYSVTQADLDAGTIMNTASVAGDPAGPEPLLATTASEVVQAQQSSGIDLVKTADVTTVDAVGDPINYTLSITNTGNTTLTNVWPDDPMPGIVPNGCTPAPGSALAPGETMTCTATYLTTHADLEAGAVRNTAAVRADSPTGLVTDTDAANVTAIYAPAISLTKSVSAPTNWVAGATLEYSFTVTNVGTMTATAVAVADPLPGMTTPTCQATTLEPGESTTCTASYVTTQADVDRGRVDNTATATASEVTGQPYRPVSASAATTTTLQGSMTLDKTVAENSYAAVGDVLHYTFVVRNTGPVSLSGLAVSDPLPGMSAVSCPDGGGLLPGATMTCTASYTVTQADLDAGSVANQATARAVDAHGNRVPDATDGAVAAAAQAPALALTKTPNVTSVDGVGERVGYTFVITNTGNVTVTDARITDAVAGVTLTGCTAASIAPNETFSCTGTYTVTQADMDAGTIRNAATASAGSPAGPVTSPEASSSVGVEANPAITLDKTASTATVANPGDEVTYTFVARNTGNVTLSGVTVVDPKAGLSALDCAQPAVLAPGASLTCTARYTVPQAEFDTGTIANAATVSAEAPGGDPASPADDVTARATVTLDTTPRGSQTLSKTVSPTVVQKAGDPVTYTFVVANTGNVTLHDITLEDRLAGLSPYQCDADTIAPGASTTCTSTYAALQADIDRGSFTNTATVVATTPAGVRTAPATASATVTAPWSPKLDLKKTADHQGVTQLGEQVKYTFIGTNLGNVTANVVTVTDPKPGLSPLDCSPSLPAVLAPGANIICSATYTFQQSDLDAGSIANTATITGQDPAGNPIAPASASEVVSVSANNQLVLEKNADTTTVAKAGDPIHYVLKATNRGNQTLTDVRISDPLAEGAGAALNCTPTNGARLEPGQAMVCQFDYQATQANVDAGFVTNTASASGLPPGTTERAAADDATATVVMPVDPSVTLTKEIDGPTTVSGPGTVWYRFTMTNTGNVTAHAPTITDGMTSPIVCQAGRPASVPTAAALPATLAPEASATCWAAYEVTQGDIDRGVPLVNRETLSATYTEQNSVDPTNPGQVAMAAVNAEATLGVTRTPGLTFDKAVDPTSVSAPGEARYTFVLRNSGNTTLNAVTLTDRLPGLSALDCGDAATAPAATLRPGDTATCTATYQVTQDDIDAGSVLNTATVTADPEGGPDGDTITLSRSATVTAERQAALTLDKTSPTSQITEVGQEVPYAFVITNTGNVTLSDVTLADALPGLPEPTCDGEGDLAVGGVRTCTATYTVTQDDLDAGSLVNTATARAGGPDGMPVTADTDSVAISAIAPADATFGKRAAVADSNGNGLADPGETIQYTLTVENTGSRTLTGVRVTDSLPGLTAVNCPGGQPARIAPGDVLTCTASYRVTTADQQNGLVTNLATMQSDQLDARTASAITAIAAAPAQPTPTPTPGPTRRPRPPILPQTGAGDPTIPLTIAAIALLAGLVVLFARRRRNDEDEGD